MRKWRDVKKLTLLVCLFLFIYWSAFHYYLCMLNQQLLSYPDSKIEGHSLDKKFREIPKTEPNKDENYVSMKLINRLQRKLHSYKKQEMFLRKQLKFAKEINEKLQNKKLRDAEHQKMLPTIFMVTPTFKRFVQKAELTRVWQAIRSVKNIHWIVVEDSAQKTDLVRHFLNRTNLNYTHLNVQTPEELRRRKGDHRRMKPRGVEQRNLALTWIRKNIDPGKTKGVVYFADDDNTYDSQLFEEMRFIQRVGVWPVAFTSAARWAGPVCKEGHVTGFHVNWGEWRPFPIDMAGFAINIQKLISEFPEALFQSLKKPGMLESSLLQQITSIDKLEPLASNCSKVYVWHTRSEVPSDSIRGERRLIANGKGSNPRVET